MATDSTCSHISELKGSSFWVVSDWRGRVPSRVSLQESDTGVSWAGLSVKKFLAGVGFQVDCDAPRSCAFWVVWHQKFETWGSMAGAAFHVGPAVNLQPDDCWEDLQSSVTIKKKMLDQRSIFNLMTAGKTYRAALRYTGKFRLTG